MLLLNQAASAGFAHEAAECSKILGMSVVATGLYATVHNQIAVRLSPEYFGEGFARSVHLWTGPLLSRLKKIIETTKSPTVVALVWGFLQWPVGAILGVPILAASRIGSWPKMDAVHSALPVTIAVCGTGIATLNSAIRSYLWAKQVASSGGDIDIRRYVANRVDRSAYSYGVTAGLGLVFYVLAKRSGVVDVSTDRMIAAAYLFWCAIPSFL